MRSGSSSAMTIRIMAKTSNPSSRERPFNPNPRSNDFSTIKAATMRITAITKKILRRRSSIKVRGKTAAAAQSNASGQGSDHTGQGENGQHYHQSAHHNPAAPPGLAVTRCVTGSYHFDAKDSSTQAEEQADNCGNNSSGIQNQQVHKFPPAKKILAAFYSEVCG